MSDILIEVESGKSKRLLTANKVCKDDIIVTATGGSGGENPFEDAMGVPSFEAIKFPDGYELTVDIPLRSLTDEDEITCQNRFRQITGVKKLTLKGNVNGCKFNAQFMFYSNTTLKILDISDFRFTPSNMNSCFTNSTQITSIIGVIDGTHLTSANNTFGMKNSPLVDVGFVPNTISVGLNFSTCAKLSDDSIDSIIKGLADLTGQTAQNLVFHSTVTAKIMANPVWDNAITSKNFTYE